MVVVVEWGFEMVHMRNWSETQAIVCEWWILAVGRMAYVWRSSGVSSSMARQNVVRRLSRVEGGLAPIMPLCPSRPEVGRVGVPFASGNPVDSGLLDEGPRLAMSLTLHPWRLL